MQQNFRLIEILNRQQRVKHVEQRKPASTWPASIGSLDGLVAAMALWHGENNFQSDGIEEIRSPLDWPKI